MLTTTLMQMVRTMVVLSFLGGGSNSQSSGGSFTSFNRFINNNSILNSTATEPSVSPEPDDTSSAVSTAGRNENLLYQMRQR